MEHLPLAACVCLNLFILMATLDGLYFHLWKYRLYARAESLYEHKLHTIRAFLFIPIVFFLFVRNFAGPLLWFGIFFLLVDFVVEFLDVFCERNSRALIGGLSSTEYATHIAATTFRVAAIALILGSKPASAWNGSTPLVAKEYPVLVSLSGVNILVGNFLVSVLHLWLMQKKYRIKTSPSQSSGGLR